MVSFGYYPPNGDYSQLPPNFYTTPPIRFEMPCQPNQTSVPDPILKSYLECLYHKGVPQGRDKLYNLQFYSEYGYGCRMSPEMDNKLQSLKKSLKKGDMPRWAYDVPELKKMAEKVIQNSRYSLQRRESRKVEKKVIQRPTQPKIAAPDERKLHPRVMAPGTAEDGRIKDPSVRIEAPSGLPMEEKTEGQSMNKAIEELKKKYSELERQQMACLARCRQLEELVTLREALLQSKEQTIQSKDQIIAMMRPFYSPPVNSSAQPSTPRGTLIMKMEQL